MDEPVEVLAELKLPPIPRLDAIIGQGRAVHVLKKTLTSQRVPHAWIFHGPAGVGKFTTALGFAACLMDDTTGPTLGGEIEPDPESPTQQRLAGGSHPDLHVIRKELALFSSERAVRDRKLATIPIEVIREHLIEPAYLAPAISRKAMAPKVFIVDEAELLDRSPTNAPVQNALLKTLEEPPAGTVLILVTTSEDRLLPTIRSRCQRVAFRSLTDDEMRQWFHRTRRSESSDWLLRFAQGSPGRYIEAVEAGIDRWEPVLSPLLDGLSAGQLVFDLGAVAHNLIESYASTWVDAGPNRSKEAANRAGARQLLSILGEHFRAAVRSGRDPNRAARAIIRLEQSERELASNVQPALVFDALAADLAKV
ncbi:MAG: AAA family ATPase [Leptolyngbya sp. PLA3]|nr:MAG: DNA polymerase III subunit delta' [Cyanobacteria bacterium CYA]MCE7969642.1 AAA family ATPase [Leptolyngbya sp. PL-A3]